ncbi:MAG: hypothetical protein RR420_01325 [Anaerovoracaceae bacterium]
MKNTLVISAFPCCGKTYFTNNHKDWGIDIDVADSDSSKFSWIETDKGRVRNTNFINDYMEHITSLAGKVDIIFVSSHKDVREALWERNIPHVIICPVMDAKEEWTKRMVSRGNSPEFIEFITSNWESFISEINMTSCSVDDKTPRLLCHLSKHGHIGSKMYEYLLKPLTDFMPYK